MYVCSTVKRVVLTKRIDITRSPVVFGDVHLEQLKTNNFSTTTVTPERIATIEMVGDRWP